MVVVVSLVGVCVCVCDCVCDCVWRLLLFLLFCCCVGGWWWSVVGWVGGVWRASHLYWWAVHKCQRGLAWQEESARHATVTALSGPCQRLRRRVCSSLREPVAVPQSVRAAGTLGCTEPTPHARVGSVAALRLHKLEERKEDRPTCQGMGGWVGWGGIGWRLTFLRQGNTHTQGDFEWLVFARNIHHFVGFCVRALGGGQTEEGPSRNRPALDAEVVFCCSGSIHLVLSLRTSLPPPLPADVRGGVVRPSATSCHESASTSQPMPTRWCKPARSKVWRRVGCVVVVASRQSLQHSRTWSRRGRR